MSALTICDLSFIEELDNCESKIAGAASAGASAGAGGGDAVAAGGSTSSKKGSVYASASGSYRSRDYYGSYRNGPSASVNVNEPYYYF